MRIARHRSFLSSLFLLFSRATVTADVSHISILYTSDPRGTNVYSSLFMTESLQANTEKGAALTEDGDYYRHSDYNQKPPKAFGVPSRNTRYSRNVGIEVQHVRTVACKSSGPQVLKGPV
ncbi:hypothetical protein EV421DRAFT_1843304 [Armillaria borealis]|uniref:Uncharacterized protein n=1 Tax=Armillaria borealis TaxID=47425 RepID=A0AA39J080_9AGAR|nr:hypothetical protein EV421DRAFT_1843304 [Armillaria borealis]